MKTRIIILIASATLVFSSCDTLNQGSFNLPSQSNGSSSGNNKTTPPNSGNITEKEAMTGVKEALNTGLQNSIQTLAKKDGFLGDAAVKILMPQEAKKVESALRAVPWVVCVINL